MKKKYHMRKLLVFILFLLQLSVAHSQSDNCAGAANLSIGTSCTTTAIALTGFNNDGPAPICGTSFRDGWFSITTDATTTSITIQGTSDKGLGLQLFSGNCGTLNSVACTIPGTLNANLSTAVLPNTTYLLRLMRTNNFNANSFTGTICVFANPAAPINDQCAGAISLTVNSSCSYNTYTNASATPSNGIPLPNCASYSGGDVWFSAIVPANGILTVDTQTGVMLDSGMAFYTGTCGSLTLLECDDDDSVNGFMSSITRTGLTPGSTIYIRIWEYFGDNNGTFGICATTPAPCSQTPTALSAVSATATTANLAWTAATPAPVGGYEYIYSTNPTPPTAGATPAGSVAAGITTLNLSGLTANTTYYFWVRSVCVGTERSGWAAGSFFTGYCIADSTSSTYYINNFSTTGGILNISNANSGYSAGGYGNFTAQAVSQSAGSSVNFSSIYYDGIYSYGFNIWVDWNNDFDFNDAGEKVYSSGTYSVSNAASFTIPIATVNGNYRMRIRADYWSTNPLSCGTITSGETEDYTLTVTPPPPCSGNPTGVAVNVTTQTTATVSWNAASPIPANGYQYYFSTSAVNPSPGTLPAGSVGAGVLSANLSGLTSGATYYIWIRSNCGGGLGVGSWVGPISFIIPSCGIGNSSGTTTLGCPSVVSGGLSLNGADPAPIDCSSSGCVDLEANYLQLGRTTNYTVENIPFAPPYQFGCLKNPVSVNDDDVWSPVINLPFNFCFYGTTYNQCLISSNGVISFDMVNNTPGGYSAYSFASNLPNASLFRNSIFGVYHDIDPSIGGEVGWELITLNTGCRALVASWNNIPMFSSTCNSQVYTGMMVLYENTNIIDVYIQTKNVCASWNGGNAIVGLQNAAGTQAVVAPGRNGLDADWTVTNEAWRFVPSGAAITSIVWHEGSGILGPSIGITDVITVCPSTTTTYTAEVTYTLCNGVILKEIDETTVIVNKNKIWNGSVSTNWNVPANWTPIGVPTALDCVEIPNVTNDCIISGAGYDGYAYSLSVLADGQLDINSQNNLTVTSAVNIAVGGIFNIKNSASLIQIDNVPNTGIINMERISQPVYRFDYTYWNSPVTLNSAYTLGNLSPNTQPDKYYSWMPSVGGISGNWIQESTATIMNPNKGYIIRAPQSYSPNPLVVLPYTANFIGTPNNGTITCPVTYGTMGALATDDKWNLLGNPYPSAVSAASFLNNANNASVIDGTIYFWTHNSPPSVAFPDPFYADFVINYTASDYASWNKTGGVGTIASSGGPAPNGYIAAGQAFFVKSLAVPGNAVFENNMRISNFNTQFFRQSGPISANANFQMQDEVLEKHRLWLNLTNGSGVFNQILVGYVEQATQGWDRGFDGLRFTSSGVSFYSIIPENKLVIQGRALPFHGSDIVPLGYSSNTSEPFTIRIDHLDGIFENRRVFVEDKLLNIIHDLKAQPYTFTTEIGTFDDRFQLRYRKKGRVNSNENDNLIAFVNNKILSVKSDENIETVEIYDFTGKRIATYSPEKATSEFETNFVYSSAIYIVKVTLHSSEISIKTLIIRN